jgi:hypothetical protein
MQEFGIPSEIHKNHLRTEVRNFISVLNTHFPCAKQILTLSVQNIHFPSFREKKIKSFFFNFLKKE